MTPEFDKAATKAAETLVKYGIKASPVSPLKILEQMENVITISFSDLSDTSGLKRCDMLNMFGKNRDAISSFHHESGSKTYIVAYNRLLPSTMVQKALARELGHIVLHHEENSPENTSEAICFAQHLLCPRPLLRLVQAASMRFTIF